MSLGITVRIATTVFLLPVVVVFLLPAVRQQIVLLEVPVAIVAVRAFVIRSTAPRRISNYFHRQYRHQHQHHYRSLPWQRAKGTLTRLSLSAPLTSGDDRNSISNQPNSPPPIYGLYEVQEEMLIKRGIYEEQLMSHTKSTPLPHIVPPVLPQKRSKSTAGATKGFGSSSTTTTTTATGQKKSKSSATLTRSYTDDAKHYASILRTDGLVRIDDIIPHGIVDELKEFVLKLRHEATIQMQVPSPQPPQLRVPIVETRFADVLLRTNRCDLKMPIGYNQTVITPVVSALYHALCESPVSETISQMFPRLPKSIQTPPTTTTTKSKLKKQANQNNSENESDAVLYELSCLISDYGSHRQVVHPDNPFLSSTGNDTTNDPTDSHQQQSTPPTLLTCFIALQDIINVDMGPTIFLPNTHRRVAHEQFLQDTILANDDDDDDTTTDPILSPKDVLLRDSPSVMGTLTKGYATKYGKEFMTCDATHTFASFSCKSTYIYIFLLRV